MAVVSPYRGRRPRPWNPVDPPGVYRNTATPICYTSPRHSPFPPGRLPLTDFARRRAPLLLVLLLAACGGGREPITLGVAAPIGDNSYGDNSLRGAQLAVREINAEGGINGRELRLEALSDSGSESGAIRVAERLATNPAVLAVVGHASSGPMVKASTTYQSVGLPAVGTSATSTAISGLGDYIFRVAGSDSANAAELARTARTLGGRVAIFYSNDDYGQSLQAVFRNSLRDTGARVVANDPYLEEMPAENFEPYLRRLASRGADVILVAGYEVGAANLIPRARALMPQVHIMGGDGLEPLVGMGPQFEGTYVGMLFHPDVSPRARTFTAAYRAAFQREPDSSAATSYDAVYLLTRAMRAGHLTRREIRDYLAGVGRQGGSPAFEGVSGPVRFDANGDPVEKPFTVVVIRGGKFVLPTRGS
jgi:branched-chain amino acid transport system substrate-binding protein